MGLDRMVTDDLGNYRLYGLEPGEYIVAASPDAAAAAIFHATTEGDVRRVEELLRTNTLLAGSPTFRPEQAVRWVPVFHSSAVAHPAADVVRLGDAEERLGVDITMRFVPTARITGTVVSPDGSPVKGASMFVADAQPILGTSIGLFKSLQGTDAQGRFEIPDLAPGRYTIFATPGGALKASTDVVVDGQDLTVSLSLTPARRVLGRIVFEGRTESRPALANRVLLALRGNYSWAQRMNGQMTAADNGTFVFRDVWPGTYRLMAPPPGLPGWRLKSAVLGGVDVLDAHLEVRPGEDVTDLVVTLTDQPTEISGRLVDDAGEPVTRYVLLVFSSDPRHWGPNSRRVQQIRPGSDGSYRLNDLPAGTYLISAVTDVEPGQWNDPSYLASLASAGPVRVTLADGQKQIQDIKVR
jgi:hypothetical protein